MSNAVTSALVEFVAGTGFRALTTSTGLVVTLLLIALVVEREVLRLAVAEDRRALVRAVDLAIVPIAVVWALVVLTRFQSIR